MLKILVVDDEKQARDNMIHCINVATNGFEIIGAAADGSEALEMIRQTQPDIVLIDIQMPGISGLDVIAEARKEDLPVTFIIISSYSEFSFAQEAIRLGVFEYLLKPFMPADVCAAVYIISFTIVNQQNWCGKVVQRSRRSGELACPAFCSSGKFSAKNAKRHGNDKERQDPKNKLCSHLGRCVF